MATSKKSGFSTHGKINRSKGTSAKKREQESQSLHISELAAVVLLISALMLMLSVFGVHALLLDCYANFVKGLVGCGFYILPVSFIATVWQIVVTLDSRRKPSQMISFLVLPVIIGAWGHLFTSWGNNYLTIGISRLYFDGIELKCGGILAGLLADVISYLLSPFGTVAVLLAVTFVTSVWLVRLEVKEVWSQISTGIRSKGQASEEAYDHRREERRIRREEERKQREMQWEKELEEERKTVSAGYESNASRTNPADYDMPLENEKPKPRGVFKLPEDGKGGELPFNAQQEDHERVFEEVNMEEMFSSDSETDNIPDTMQEVPQEEIDVGEDEDGMASEDPIIGDEEDTNDATITDEMIQMPDENQDMMLEEAGIKRQDIEQDETRVSSSLRPGMAEKQRLAENRVKNQLPPYQKPLIDLLKQDNTPPSPASEEEVKQNAKRLIETLQSFNIDARITNVIRGPSITRYEVQLKQGIRFSKLTSLSDDIALALAAQAVRIAAIPDRVSIGIEVPNKVVSTVYIRDCIDSAEFAQNPSKVAFALGKDITGKVIAWDIAKLPHMLVAGTTGSGKSVCINSLLISLIYKANPDEVKFIMIDPKIIELGVYNGIPHLMTPVVTDPKKAAGALQWAVYEMMRRYKQMADLGVRSVFEYNAEVERRWSQPKEEGDEDRQKLPQIVIVIDELADLMLSSPREVEEAICRIAQMARAAGMHLIIATQRPSADVITGLMKANIPSRIAFAVSSAMESRIILDTQGAETLIGKGDMLFSPIGAAKPIRIQGCFISSSEIEAVCAHAKQYGAPDYDQSVLEHIEKASQDIGKGKKANSNEIDHDDGEDDAPEDPMIFEAIDVVMESQMASASGLQRRLKLGYTRAARLIDIMEEKGIVGPFQGSKPREILMSKDRWMEMKAARGE